MPTVPVHQLHNKHVDSLPHNKKAQTKNHKATSKTHSKDDGQKMPNI